MLIEASWHLTETSISSLVLQHVLAALFGVVFLRALPCDAYRFGRASGWPSSAVWLSRTLESSSIAVRCWWRMPHAPPAHFASLPVDRLAASLRTSGFAQAESVGASAAARAECAEHAVAELQQRLEVAEAARMAAEAAKAEASPRGESAGAGGWQRLASLSLRRCFAPFESLHQRVRWWICLRACPHVCVCARATGGGLAPQLAL